ncbi:zinc ABC transporter substrate-binding protein ZnuA [Orbaceae bacterium ESL0727]|nr:zinc ABC transporter substrate-binding protein ZnuA [Orbaceae bacterium ESL0727]
MQKFMALFCRFFTKVSVLFLFMITSLSAAHATIVVSVKPIGFIVEAIADGVTDTSVLLPDGASPHTYSLKPSDLAKIHSAELVVWISEDMETFLPNVLKSVAESKQLALTAIPQIQTLLRKGHSQANGDSDHHDDASDHDHDHGTHDEHIWLSPQIVKIIAHTIRDRLIAQYPDKQAVVDENLNEFMINLTETEQNIAKKLIPVQNKGYFVFHDAYGYFESQFGLKNLGSFTLNPAVQPGVQTVYAIQQSLKEHHAVCVFREPQFSPSVIDKLVKGTTVRVGELDPLGTGIAPAKDAYSQLLLKLTGQLLACLDHQ